jgi:predicted Zn-dependent protease
MNRLFLAFLFFSSALISCSRNAVTGRKQFKLLPESELQTMAAGEYKQFLAKNKVVSIAANRDAEMVRRVGERITKAVESYYQSIGKTQILNGYKWEYNLVEDKAVNAWCMPGGKIVVYTGLLSVTQNEAALAIVMGHEVSHAIFQHGNERISQQLGTQLVGAGLQAALASKPAETQNAFLLAYGIGAQTGLLLPYSRKHELEADRYGLWWAAMAGYNPQEAIPLWERMEKAGNGTKPPEFLSTHPSEGRRIEQLKKYMDEALKLYKPMTK